jgi:hypothetical protein
MFVERRLVMADMCVPVGNKVIFMLEVGGQAMGDRYPTAVRLQSIRGSVRTRRRSMEIAASLCPMQ